MGRVPTSTDDVCRRSWGRRVATTRRIPFGQNGYDEGDPDQQRLCGATDTLSTVSTAQLDDHLEEHQPGIVTAPLSRVLVAAFDITAPDVAGLRDLFQQLADETDARNTLIPCSHGDLLMQICGGTDETTHHALRRLMRVSRRHLTLRWMPTGFQRPNTLGAGRTSTRNLLGFKDGTANPDAVSATSMDDIVWVRPGDDEPDWAIGGRVKSLASFATGWNSGTAPRCAPRNSSSVDTRTSAPSSAPPSKPLRPTTTATRRQRHAADRSHPPRQPSHREQRTANSEQRTANSEQRTANSEQRTANSEQRTANSSCAEGSAIRPVSPTTVNSIRGCCSCASNEVLPTVSSRCRTDSTEKRSKNTPAPSEVASTSPCPAAAPTANPSRRD
jgi:hypothetical protein